MNKKKISNRDVIDDWSAVPEEILENFGEEGDFARKHLLNPSLFSLLGDVKNKKVLDAGCGEGYLSRLLARKGAIVMGVESAENMYSFAVTKEEKQNLGITYIKKDLSQFESTAKFDIVVSNMVFMDIPDFESAMKNCMRAVRKDGHFIFSILHPCFEESGREYSSRKCVTVKEYFKEYEIKQTFGYSFHRPLNRYINVLAGERFLIEATHEPQLRQELANVDPAYEKDVHVPSFLIVKARKLGSI